MGGGKIFLCCHRNEHLVVSLLFLIVSNLSLLMLIEGKPLTKLFHSTHVLKQRGMEEGKMVRGAQIIGSRPPKCEGRCGKCGRCEAVQVPIVTTHAHAHLHQTIQYSRGDDISNYKPMSWKCKCGNSIFNP